ncbi:MAG: hypothetical protein ACTHQE_13100 [Thermomicrobiales bacterium]
MTLSFDILQPRTGEGLSFYLRSIGGEWFFRVGPVRDPDQPRFWRLMVEPCSAPTSVEPRSRYEPFLAPALIPRDQLSEHLSAIKDKPMDWLGQAENRELADWLGAVTAQAVPKRTVPEALRKPQKSE